MKQFIAALLVIAVLCTSVSAAGDPNVDGGGGGTGDGTGENFWSIGNDGVRVTVIQEEAKNLVTTPIDFTNQSPIVSYYFGNISKLSYSNGDSLALREGNSYHGVNPATPIPPIVTADGNNNIAAVKEYFGREGTIQDIAEKTGFDYDTLINGEYVILLEPLVYLTYNGVKMAMTATEAALYDQLVSGDLKRKMGFVTHQNLPLAMFLERSDLGYPAWSGATSGIRTNSEIISFLGLGTVRFSEALPPSGGGEAVTIDYTYHTNTEVVTSVELSNNSDKGISPDNPASVTFTIDGRNYTKHGIVIPPHESTLAWVKWTTPSTPQTMTISVHSNGAAANKSQITAKIVALQEITPPDPQPTDTKPNPYWAVPSVPSKTSKSHLTWGEWWAWWQEKWEWESDWDWVSEGHESDCPDNCGDDHGYWEDNGKYVDKGWWVYEYDNYYLSGNLRLTVKPDALVPTAIQRGSKQEIKSGYGINIEAVGDISTNADVTDISGFQNVIATFPDFDYKTYNRVLERKRFGSRSEFELYLNKYSLKKARSHYTPIWYPDNSKYEPQIMILDAWCRATRS